MTLTFIICHHIYKCRTRKSSSSKEAKQHPWSTTVSWGVMFSTYKNVDVLLLEVLKTEQRRWSVTHPSNFSRGLSWGGVTESWRVLPWVGIKHKCNYSSSFRFKTGPPAEKSLPTDPVVTHTLQPGFPLKYNKAFYLFFIFFFFLESNNHVLHYRL